MIITYIQQLHIWKIIIIASDREQEIYSFYIQHISDIDYFGPELLTTDASHQNCNCLGMTNIVRNALIKIFNPFLGAEAIWAPSQYKDRLIYVWRFPC